MEADGSVEALAGQAPERDRDKTDREVPALAPRRDWIAESDITDARVAAAKQEHRTSVGAPRSVSRGIREQGALRRTES